MTYVFNTPPGWEVPGGDWRPPEGWTPDPTWPPAPDGWEFWVRRAAPLPPPPPPPEVSVPPKPVEAPPVDGVLQRRIAELEAEVARLQAEATVVLDDERVLQEVGIYQYHHPLENAAAYKTSLSELNEQIKAMVKAGDAVLASDMFTFNNSLAKGRKMTAEFSKLMLRAYNAEADNSIRSLRVGNVVTAKKRLDASRESIAKLGLMMEMRISDEFHVLRVEEIELTADWLMMKQQEKEDAREERERLREERKVQQELNSERERLDKERAHLANALAALKTSGDSDPALEQSLAAIDAAIEANDYRAANIRAGYVYVISNRGAFGPGVVKIGLTRRLEPLDRVAELGDASVPFRFDVHALYFSEDAVTLENELHAAFAARTLNKANLRKEFFFASPAEVREVLTLKVGNLLEFTEHAEATEYNQSVAQWPPDIEIPGPQVASA